MPRPAIYSADGILDAARDLVLADGARAATVEGIMGASGASKGSIYHRFDTLGDLLAAMWLRAVRRSQDTFLQALEEPVALEAAVAAGLSIHDFSRASRADARLLASLRRSDLLGGVSTSTALADELDEVNDRLALAIRGLATRLRGDVGRTAIEWTTCAVIDLPQGAVRRHLIAGTPLPRGLRPQLEAAIRAALGTPP